MDWQIFSVVVCKGVLWPWNLKWHLPGARLAKPWGTQAAAEEKAEAELMEQLVFRKWSTQHTTAALSKCVRCLVSQEMWQAGSGISFQASQDKFGEREELVICCLANKREMWKRRAVVCWAVWLRNRHQNSAGAGEGRKSHVCSSAWQQKQGCWAEDFVVDKVGWKKLKSQLDKPTEGCSLLCDPGHKQTLCSTIPLDYSYRGELNWRLLSFRWLSVLVF